MYVVTVVFQSKPENSPQMQAALLRQAENSIRNEEGCHQFDICVDPENNARFFLYEIYTDEAAFMLHVASDHMAAFSKEIEDWVLNKLVTIYHRL